MDRIKKAIHIDFSSLPKERVVELLPLLKSYEDCEFYTKTSKAYVRKDTIDDSILDFADDILISNITLYELVDYDPNIEIKALDNSYCFISTGERPLQKDKDRFTTTLDKSLYKLTLEYLSSLTLLELQTHVKNAPEMDAAIPQSTLSKDELLSAIISYHEEISGRLVQSDIIGDSEKEKEIEIKVIE